MVSELYAFTVFNKCYIWNIDLYGAEIWTLWTLQKYLGSFLKWSWRRMEKISWTDRVRNVEVLHRVKEGRNILWTAKRKKDNWIGNTLRRNCLRKHVIEGKIKDTWREDEEEDASGYLLSLRKRKDNGNRNRKLLSPVVKNSL